MIYRPLFAIFAIILFTLSCERHHAQPAGPSPLSQKPTPRVDEGNEHRVPKRNTPGKVISDPNTNMTDSFLIAFFSTIVAGLLSAAGINIYRYIRMKAALLEDIQTQLGTVKEVVTDLEKLMNRFVHEGKTVDQSGHYIITEYELFKALQSELFAYFPARLGRITRFYRHLQEMDILMKRLYDELTEFKNDHTPLTKEDASYLKGKFARIADMMKVLPGARISSLGQLPSAYGRQVTLDVMREFIEAIQQSAMAIPPPKQLIDNTGVHEADAEQSPSPS
jgi:hypothetical protein